MKEAAVEQVWREMKEEAPEVMTLEEFLLAKTAGDEEEDSESSKRTMVATERARQRRMIKNRESAARSRDRKQAHQLHLESLISRLHHHRHSLLLHKAHRANLRLNLLFAKLIPVEEKPRPPRVLRRVHSLEW